MKYIKLFITMAWLSIITSVNAVAEESNEVVLADEWVVTVNVNDRQAFESALSKHMKFRVDAKDPRQWDVYTQVIGEQMQEYVLRSCCIDWNSIEAYRQWSVTSKTSAHWSKTVSKYTQGAKHYYSEIDTENSNWDNDKKFKYFGVSRMFVAPGEGFELRKSIKEISDAAKKMKWEKSFSWSSPIGGSDRIVLVVGYESYGAMTPPKDSFFKRLSELMGDKEKATSLLENYSEHFSHSDYAVYVHREDLSMAK
ncbi:hypothetical protein [Thalassomonas sp. M1454]|uniref:hypothetical protein n=1 Tax=Thalassomonas sp. M1454 TaxID=2594477 RepID=UPI00117D95E9|nr:hypothetical protein [Thalassomonas sp. M1454]TRX57017.1 hypothetical protein FNN08_05795 [Thalassomonas sp. M1454]